MDTALALFVSQNRRLPCPADGTLASGHATAGTELTFAAGPCSGNQQNGVVPWRALGLSEQDATDGWGNRLTYRVANTLVTASAMNFSRCDPAGTADPNPTVDITHGYCLYTATPSATFNAGEWTDTRKATANLGLPVQNLGGIAIMIPTNTPSTGAAYVVISHGENGEGAYNNQGVLQPVTSSGTEEARNAANLALAAYYVDDFPVYVAGAGHFDDFVLRPSILTVATKAQLGPRAH